MSAWFGLAAPGAVPDPIVARLNAELVRAFSSSEVSKCKAGEAGKREARLIRQAHELMN